MALAGFFPLGLALLAFRAAGTAPAGAGRGLKSLPQQVDHIWGRCDQERQYPHGGSGCYLEDGETCSGRLSDGPADADVEVVLGNLPASTPDVPVHLTFWAPYESTRSYDPLQSHLNASIYLGFLQSWPKYYDAEFNGGNVPVNESGFATIRIRDPAIYIMHPYLTMPHAYLRVCYSESGDSVVMKPDTLLFGIGEQWVSTKSQDSRIQVVSARAYEASADAVTYDIPHPYAYVSAIHHPDQDDEEEISEETEGVSTTAVTTESPSPELSQMIETAKEALDLDALTYSPVYGCFLENQYYSHYEDGCVDKCEGVAGAYAEGEAVVVAHGQCVRAEVLEDAESFRAEWEVEVHCSDLCGSDAANETLHTVRLEAAGLLDVPFQEVTDVSMQWVEAAAGRRLEQEVRALVLQVSVTTRRVAADVAEPLLGALLTEAPAASALLQMQVASVEQLSSPVDIDPDLSMGEGSDPYEAAYEYVEPSADGSAGEEAAAGSAMPAVIIAVVATCAVLLGALIGATIYWRRQRARLARDVAASKVEDPWEAVPGVMATEIGQPDQEENNTGAGVL